VRIGIDLGGTKIEATVLDSSGVERVRRRVATPRHDYEATLSAIVNLVETVEREVGASGTVGVGMPGVISPSTGLVKNSNSVWLNGRAFDRDLTERLGRPVRFANDANCFALSEAIDGGAAGGRVVFGVILGTGAGGGVVVNAQVLTGPNAIAGEWGHNPLPWPRDGEWPGPPCYCGKTACVETFLSGPSLARDYWEVTGTALSAPEITRRAAEGDPGAEAALARYEDRLARALALVVNIVDPDVIVVGGGMSHIQRLYASVPPLLAKYVFSDSLATRIVPPVHGDSSGVRGAARLWPHDE
jgi:fructokinase